MLPDYPQSAGRNPAPAWGLLSGLPSWTGVTRYQRCPRRPMLNMSLSASCAHNRTRRLLAHPVTLGAIASLHPYRGQHRASFNGTCFVSSSARPRRHHIRARKHQLCGARTKSSPQRNTCSYKARGSWLVASTRLVILNLHLQLLVEGQQLLRPDLPLHIVLQMMSRSMHPCHPDPVTSLVLSALS